jgi:hypothetical protein
MWATLILGLNRGGVPAAVSLQLKAESEDSVPSRKGPCDSNAERLIARQQVGISTIERSVACGIHWLNLQK